MLSYFLLGDDIFYFQNFTSSILNALTSICIYNYLLLLKFYLEITSRHKLVKSYSHEYHKYMSPRIYLLLTKSPAFHQDPNINIYENVQRILFAPQVYSSCYVSQWLFFSSFLVIRIICNQFLVLVTSFSFWIHAISQDANAFHVEVSFELCRLYSHFTRAIDEMKL